ncbi:RNA-binding protein [Bowmanella sp. Y26]|uniref:RRM domain-containing protein n=2 Tax=Bowmanella TaxID=366580 RepID=A0ABP3H6X8_9ALTE|nr:MULTISPECIES: RNA-binding protein [Bowmanella]MBN7820723.1 RNA-binding protein [Bowmanella yangjiangensis]MBT1063608.1 RNA-binding protein [Bowmanella yangjiangensis]
MKLYVGNLSYQMTDADLEAAFAAFGAVSSAKIITDRETNRSKGFGFVEFENRAEAEAAIESLNGKEVSGRALVVNEARPPKPRTGGHSNSRGRF